MLERGTALLLAVLLLLGVNFFGDAACPTGFLENSSGSCIGSSLPHVSPSAGHTHLLALL